MPPLKIAHRGAMAEAPENTRSAFDRAIAAGVDGIEFDVHITSDGVPVIFHDNSLRRMTGDERAVPDLTLAELAGYDVGKWFSEAFLNEKILTIGEMLTAYASRTRLFIEIKSPPNPRFRALYGKLPGLVVEAVRANVPKPNLSGIHVLAFDPAMLRAAFLKNPDLKYVLNLEAPFAAGSLSEADTALFHGYCLDQGKLSPEFVAECHAAGRKTFTYSCDTWEQIQRAVEAGVDGIMTDDPGGPGWRQFSMLWNK